MEGTEKGPGYPPQPQGAGYPPQPQGAGYPPAYSGYPPQQPPAAGYPPPPGGQQMAHAPPQHQPPQQTSQFVVVQTTGTCPNCRVGVLQEDFTLLGILCAICFFPLGLLCCFLMRERRCSNCGNVYD